MKQHFYPTYKIASQIILCVLIVFSLSLMLLSYKQKVAVAQGEPESWEWRIVSLQEQNKLDEALKATDEYLHRFNTRETYCWGLTAKGNTLTLMGEYTKAIYAYQEALQYAPNDEYKVHILMNIGRLQHALGDYTDAISYYEEAIIRLDSSDSRRYWFKMEVAWSSFYLSKGDTVVLKEAYDRAKPILHKIENRINSFNKGSAYHLASTIAFRLGRFNDAIQLSKTYVNIKNTDSAKLSLAIDLLNLKKNSEANDVFRRVNLRNISKGLLASWYWLKGDEMQARINLERYLVEECSSEDARESAKRIIRKDEILPQDFWKEARKLNWFRELVYTNTIDFPDEKYSEQPKERSQGQRETFPSNNKDEDLEDSSTKVFTTESSSVFHKPDCSRLNKSEGLIEFATSQQASKAGLLPCNYCKP